MPVWSSNAIRSRRDHPRPCSPPGSVPGPSGIHVPEHDPAQSGPDARQLDLGHFLLLGRGEDQHDGRHKDSLLAAALEAVLAALYLDAGLLQTQEIFWRCFLSTIEQYASATSDGDYKGILQAQTLSAFGCIPTYQVVHEEGPAHQKIFHVQLTLNQAYGCVGTGRIKKAAEQHAAQQLLALLQQTQA